LQRTHLILAFVAAGFTPAILPLNFDFRPRAKKPNAKAGARKGRRYKTISTRTVLSFR
jgi:hypothetical protein